MDNQEFIKYTDSNGEVQLLANKEYVDKHGGDGEDFASAIHPTSRGRSILIKDSSEAPFDYLKIEGESRQDSTEGYNLADVDNVYHLSSPNVPVERYLNGFVVTSVKTHYRILNIPCNLEQGKTYYVDYDFEKVSGDQNDTQVYLPEIGQYITSHGTFVANQNVTKIGVYLSEENIQGKVRVWNFRVVEGNENKPYEPFTGGIASPNSQYNQEISSVGDSGSTTVHINGAQLWNYPDGTNESNGLTWNCQNDLLTLSGYCAVESWHPIVELNIGVGTYTLSNDNDRVCSVISIEYPDGTSEFAATVKNYSFTFVIDKQPQKVSLYNYAMADSMFTNEEVRVMVNAGEKALEFEPYVLQDVAIPLVESLRSVSNPNGDIIRDFYLIDLRTMTGQRIENTIECDIDVEAEALLDVSEETYESYIIYADQYVDGVFGYGMCDKLHMGFNWNDIDAFFVSNEIEYNSMQITFNLGNQSTLADLGICKFIFARKEPVITELSQEEVQVLLAAHTNYPLTTIFNSDKANMEVGYKADTQGYIDAKFEELKAAIVATQAQLL